MSDLKNESPMLVAAQIKEFGKAICPTEDFFLCDSIEKLGYKIWSDMSIHTIHYGNIPFSTY